MGTYVTEKGFNKRTYEDLVEYYRRVLTSIFGADFNLDPNQAEGALLDSLASTDAQTWDVAEDTYTSNDLRSAVGVALDNNVGALLNILRQDATKARVLDVSCIGDEGTVIPARRQVRNATTEPADRVDLETDVAVTITASAANYVRYSVDDKDGTHEITLDTVTYTVGSETSKQAVILNFVSLLETDGYTAYMSDIDGGPYLEVLIDNQSSRASNVFAVGSPTSEMTREEFGSPVATTALLEGFVDIGIGFISEIVTGVSGWKKVYNFRPKLTGTGTGVELDHEYRKRLELGVQSSGLATEQAIRRVVLNQVPEVLSCIVRSNRTMVAFAAGAPTNGQAPKSFQTYVDGVGDLPDPNNPSAVQQALAEAIFEAAGAGIEVFGTEGPIVVEDDDGEEQEVYYSIIQGIDIELKVRREKYEEFNPYPVDGDDQITANVVAYTRGNWVIDKDVIPSRLIPSVYQTVGVGSVVIEARIKGSGDPWSSDTIPIDAVSVATLDSSDVTVEDL